MLTLSLDLILISFNKLTFLIMNFRFFLCNVLSWDGHLFFYSSLYWNLCWWIGWRWLLRWWVLWRSTLFLFLKWWELIFIYFIFNLFFFLTFIIVPLIFVFLVFFNLYKFFAWFIFVILILLIFLILFVYVFLTILIVLSITFNVSSNLNPFNFTFMNGCISIVNLDFAFKSVAFYSSTRTFSSFVTDIDAFMDNSFLFLFLRLWSIIIPWLIIWLIRLVLFLHEFTGKLTWL